MKTLLELSRQQTVKRRAIEYGTSGNNIVRHYHDVFPITETLFASDCGTNGYGEREFDLFVFFDGVPDGMKVENHTIFRDHMTDEYYAKAVVNVGLQSREAFVASSDQAMERKQFIGNAIIEFVRQWNAERAAVYEKYRADWYERKEEERRAREEQRRAEEAERERQAAEEDARERAKYLGFADDMTPMQFGRLSKTMEKLVRTGEFGIQTTRDFIISLVKSGYVPTKKDNVTTFYGSRWDIKESKPRTEYRMNKNSESYKVSKTEYDFAMYLTEHTDRFN
jgi:hypothetical protein